MDANMIKIIMESHQTTIAQLIAQKDELMVKAAREKDEWMVKAVRAEALLEAERAHANTIIKGKDDQIRSLSSKPPFFFFK